MYVIKNVNLNLNISFVNIYLFSFAHTVIKVVLTFLAFYAHCIKSCSAKIITI